ncbi:sugar transferase [Algoriphagus halophytocola]|nr:sugar transferase [Algoriphagus sp. TR-M5]
MFYRKYIKRAMDIILAFLMFLIFLPIFLLVMVLLIFHHRGNPFFSQERPGKDHIPFRILKFKTMRDLVDQDGLPLADSYRITALGRVIRMSSLDEMPQLINVIRGDMSLVGPRPLLKEYLTLYSEEQSRRHEVRPGVTGWAQINGRNAISWERKFKLDVWYVDNHGFWLDWRILFTTLFNVLQGKGVTQQGHVTVGKFEGAGK